MQRVALFPFLLILFASCAAPRTYFPDRINTPLLTKQGDATLAATVKLNAPNTFSNVENERYGISNPQLDVAYAITDHIGLIASVRTVVNTKQKENGLPMDKTFSDIGGQFTGYRVDIGGGTFKKIGGKGLIELYGGVGYGQLQRKGKVLTQLDYTTQYYRLFVQPSAAFFVRKGYNLIWGMRFTYQDYVSFNSTHPDMNYFVTTTDFFIDHPESKGLLAGNYYFLDPYVGFQFGGWDWLKVDFQLGFNISFNHSYFNYMPTAGHVDVGFTFNHSFRRKKTASIIK